LIQPPLLREHRLYQADWLLRFYGFSAEEIATGATAGHLDLDLDPKLAWALQHRGQFPLDVNMATKEMLLRVPGFGTKTVDRIIAARRNRSLRYEDLVRIGTLMQKGQDLCQPAWLDTWCDDRQHRPAGAICPPARAIDADMNFAISLPERGRFDAWRGAAGMAISHQIAPDQLDWAGGRRAFCRRTLACRSRSASSSGPASLCRTGGIGDLAFGT